MKYNSILAMFGAVTVALLLGFGAPAPAYGATGGAAEIQTYIDDVIDMYKEFTCSTFRVGQYDVTYRRITYQRTYSSKDTVVSYYSGWYNGWQGQISQHKMIYTLR